MKIYFTAACQKASKKQIACYLDIVKKLESLGHQVMADHIVGDSADIFMNGDGESEEFIALVKKMMASKHQADLIVVEASNSSFSLGQEITYSLKLNKPVIVLHQKGVKKPRLLRAFNANNIYIVEYEDRELKKLLQEYIEYAKGMADTRFNFFISPEISNYLDWIAKNLRTPRAVYLRDLMEKVMDENEDYQNS